MATPSDNKVCSACGFSAPGKYCAACGQPYELKRISLKGLLHDVLHVFTHLDKGFGYTVKQLLVAPGKMQKSYIEGDRLRHQKPFSMFLICATVTALIRYWIYLVLFKYYETGTSSEADFFNEYMVLLHVVLMPVYAFISFIFFYNSKYNYAEVAVLILYSISFVLLVSICIALLKFIWPQLDTAYIELPLLTIYNAITFIHFFNSSPRWLVIVKSVLIAVLIFFLVQLLEDFVISIISK